MRVTWLAWALLLAAAPFGCGSGAAVPFEPSNDDLCLSKITVDRGEGLKIDWYPRPDWTEITEGPDSPWALGPGTIDLQDWITCRQNGQRLARPDSLDSLTITFDPPTLARVTGIRLRDDPWWNREVLVDIEALEPGDGQVIVGGSFEGRTEHATRAFHTRRLEDFLVSQSVRGKGGAGPLATLRGGLWSPGAPTSPEHEPLVVQAPLPVPWVRADGLLEAVRVPAFPYSPLGTATATRVALTWPKVGRVAPAFHDAIAATVDIVEASSVVSADVLDRKGQPVRAAVCSPRMPLFLSVALTDAQGRAVTGGGILLRSFDLDKARTYAEGDSVTIACLAPGETTLEVVAGQRVSVALTVTP